MKEQTPAPISIAAKCVALDKCEIILLKTKWITETKWIFALRRSKLIDRCVSALTKDIDECYEKTGHAFLYNHILGWERKYGPIYTCRMEYIVSPIELMVPEDIKS